MAGTKEGGKKAAATNKQRNPNYYRLIGKKGGEGGRKNKEVKDEAKQAENVQQ